MSSLASNKTDLTPEDAYVSAVTAYKSGDIEKARHLFSNVLRLRSNDARAIYNLAMMELEITYNNLQRFLSVSTSKELREPVERLLIALDAFSETQREEDGRVADAQ